MRRRSSGVRVQRQGCLPALTTPPGRDSGGPDEAGPPTLPGMSSQSRLRPQRRHGSKFPWRCSSPRSGGAGRVVGGPVGWRVGAWQRSEERGKIDCPGFQGAARGGMLAWQKYGAWSGRTALFPSGRPRRGRKARPRRPSEGATWQGSARDRYLCSEVGAWLRSARRLPSETEGATLPGWMRGDCYRTTKQFPVGASDRRSRGLTAGQF